MDRQWAAHVNSVEITFRHVLMVKVLMVKIFALNPFGRAPENGKRARPFHRCVVLLGGALRRCSTLTILWCILCPRVQCHKERSGGACRLASRRPVPHAPQWDDMKYVHTLASYVPSLIVQHIADHKGEDVVVPNRQVGGVMPIQTVVR
jgi:hypothetical protein